MSIVTAPQVSYSIAGGAEGKRRLDLLAEIMQPTTLRLLTATGLRRGDRCVDVGCGGGHVTLEIARFVGAAGTAVGIDFDRDILALAEQDAWDAGLGNARFAVANAEDFDGGPFDFAYARFLLSHVSDPDGVLGHVSRLVRPGGRVVVEDVDFTWSYCRPRNAAYDRYVELYSGAIACGGGDANLGRRLPGLAVAAELRDVAWNVFQPVHANGPHKLLSAETMEKIGPAVVRHGLATQDEIDDIVARMRAFAADHRTLVALPRIVQVWGTV
jgi:SAM-dependent methyltransferase